jgi:uncharacterized protein (TIGR00251 family)
MSSGFTRGLDYQETPDGVTFLVKVVPRAKRDEIVCVEGGALKVRVNAPPVEGKANAALVRMLAKLLSVKRVQVEIQRGENIRLKTLKVRGVGGRKLIEILGTRGRGDE